MAANTPQKKDFRVIIVGGSVAGLTLALSFERLGIDYVVLEAHRQIDPQVGASIGIFSNGARILDQLGVYDNILEYVDPPTWNEMLTDQGRLVQRSDSLRLMHACTGYPVAFLERRQALQVLYSHVQNKNRVLTGKKVVAVDQDKGGVTAICEDGSSFTGDILAGADGVHSRIRQEMWQHAEATNGLKRLATDKKAMSADYRCLFGISSPIPGLEEKTIYRTFNKNWSFLVVIGKDGQCFWFVFEKLDSTYRPPNMPRYKESHHADFIAPFLGRYVSQTVTFEALWKRKKVATLTPLEESHHSHWTYDRIVCLGDSIHKMTPNIGQGGNWAIESAAALSNTIQDLVKQTDGQPTLDQVRKALYAYQEGRKPRTKDVCEMAGFATRLEAFENPMHRIMSLYVVPYAGDMLVDVHCQSVSGAPQLNFLPQPERSMVEGTVFQTSQYAGDGDGFAWRALRALPLLLVCASAYHAGRLPSGGYHGRGESEAAILIDIGNLVALQIIGMAEMVRRGNSFSWAAAWPVFVTMGQWKGPLAYMMPAYFFLHYVQIIPGRYGAPYNRHVPVHYAKTLLPAVVVSSVLMTALSLFGGQEPNDDSWTWQPLVAVLLHRVLASCLPDTTEVDRIDNHGRDKKYLYLAYGFGGVFSAALYFSAGWTPISATTCVSDCLQVWKGLQGQGQPEEKCWQVIGFHQLALMGSGLFWQFLHFRDLRRIGRLKTNLLVVMGAVLGMTLAFGPAADPTSAEASAIATLKAGRPGDSINHTDWGNLMQDPIVVSIETKAQGGDAVKGTWQMATWQACQWRSLRDLDPSP
ncbi:hypothetical protein B0I35DRAFT_515348 [Stachybotrys elegans]|uniref:FAD-binding domain-containing protein n=1 Tax=Stachybotrys elegans TaxID=80388 RepID=A0A8K0SLG8_9HYPO|nr:hypothetical protein B0I35DRAFT_515348 [Stachybotrys elegans]